MAQVVKILPCGRTSTALSCMFNTMVADGLATQGTRASSKMVLSLFRAYSRFAPSQWETSLQNNAISLAGRKPRISPAYYPVIFCFLHQKGLYCKSQNLCSFRPLYRLYIAVKYKTILNSIWKGETKRLFRYELRKDTPYGQWGILSEFWGEKLPWDIIIESATHTVESIMNFVKSISKNIVTAVPYVF